MAQLQERLEEALPERYRIKRELGRGGMSLVFLAWDVHHERDVALKVLRPELSATLGPERFHREIKLAAGLNHPYILKLHDSGEAGGLLYYVMPYVEGESLRNRLARERQLPVADALQIAREVAEALDYAHRQGIVHRDVKPENILFEEGHALVSDFGIARPISGAQGTGDTGTGVVLGTIDYMSPEQARGRRDLDGRTDIYSLGLVLYEMLAGEPAGLTVDGTVTTLERLRPDVPLPVARAVRRAIAPDPSDRFATAGEFAAALERARRSSRVVLRLPRRWARVAVTVAASAAAVALGVKIALPGIVGPTLDASLYVVVPFGHRGGAAPRLLNGDQCELLLSHAFGRWADVRVVNRMQVQDALRGDTAVTLQVAKEVARRLGAGLVVWGEVADAGDSSIVTAALYDLTRGGTDVRSATVRVHPELSDLEAKFRELADSLILGDAPGRDVAYGALGTGVLAAWHAFAEAHKALKRWDLAAADDGFGRATGIDPTFAEAHFWLAQARAWAGAPVEGWLGSARRAAAGTDRLADRRQRSRAAGLLALAEGRYGQACAHYDSLLAADSSDFAAWFGLGECHRRDRSVVRDPSSPSNWRWRSSIHTAATAYERALDVVPSFAFAFLPFTRLSEMPFVEGYAIRGGTAAPPDTGTFFAYPSIHHDTLAFVPLPFEEFTRTAPPATLEAAVAANRQRLARVVRRWVREFSDSSKPYQELAHVLELAGALEGGGPERSALAAATRARATARSRADSIAATVVLVRVLVKLGRFEAARQPARAILAQVRDPGAEEAAHLASLAALTGQVHLTARLTKLRARASLEDPAYVAVPLPVLEASFWLEGYAALGVPAESISVAASKVDSLVLIHADPRLAPLLRCALYMPVAYSFPLLRRVPRGLGCPETSMLRMQRALAAGDRDAVRQDFSRTSERRRRFVPGEIAIEHVYHEAWLLLEVGDTAAATEHADRHLSALRALRRTVILNEPVQTAALVRLMALRAELAARAGDRTTARRWAEAAAILWQDADPELQPLVRRMRALARG